MHNQVLSFVVLDLVMSQANGRHQNNVFFDFSLTLDLFLIVDVYDFEICINLVVVGVFVGTFERGQPPVNAIENDVLFPQQILHCQLDRLFPQEGVQGDLEVFLELS